MSMFVCARCDSIRDSDDGCEEAPSPPYKAFSLLCVECVDEEEEEREAAAERHRDR